MKKEQDSNQSPYHAAIGENQAAASPREVAAMAKYHWTEEVPAFIYTEEIRKIDLHYNLL